MNRQFILVTFLLIILFLGSLRFSDDFQKEILLVTNAIKNFYLQSVDSVGKAFFAHFDQKKKIENLLAENERLRQDRVLMIAFANELSALLKESNTTIGFSPSVRLIRSISYAEFGNFQRVWLDFAEFDPNRIYGLVRNNMAAGIAVLHNGRPMALLNGDPKCSYAVYVGEEMVPGIAAGRGTKEMEVRFIPSWMKVKIGDEVYTSGFDNIFFSGLKVGKVVGLRQGQGYTSAIVEPYANPSHPAYLHVIVNVR